MIFPNFFRKLILLLFCYCCSPEAFAIGNYKTGDTLYIWANHGLSLRNSPSAKGAKKVTIPYGSQIVVLDSVKVQAFSVEDLPGITLQGYWSKVRYRELEGWVFDGYLSKYPALSKADQLQAEHKGKYPLFVYAKKNFGLVSKRRLKLDSEESTQDSLTRRDIYVYRNGITMEDSRSEYSDGGWNHQVYAFPNFSFEEFYLLFFYNLGFAREDPRYNPARKGETEWPTLRKESAEKIIITDMDGLEYWFEKKGDLTYMYISSPY